MKTFAEVFVDHWYVMVPIAVTSGIGIALVLERLITLKSASNVDKDELLKVVQSYCLQGNLQQAIAVVSQTKGPLASIIRAGLIAAANNQSEEEVQTAMDAVALREVPRLTRWIDVLSGLANVAVLLGLVGTVTGMIGAFSAVGNLPPAEKAKVLSASIAEALNATGFGILVSIILFAAWTVLTAWSSKIVDDIHESSVTVLNFILSNRERLTKVRK